MRKKPTKQPKSNVVAFPVKDSKPVINSLKADFLPKRAGSHTTLFFHIPKELSAPLGASSDVFARGDYVEMREGDLMIFTLPDGKAFLLGKIFRLGREWICRDENDRGRIYYWSEIRNGRKVTEFVEMDRHEFGKAKEALKRLIPQVEKARRRRQFPHLTSDEISFFDIDILDAAG